MRWGQAGLTQRHWRSLSRTVVNKNHRLVCRQFKPNQVILTLYGPQPAPPRRLPPQTKRTLWLRKQRKQRRRRRRRRPERRSKPLSSGGIAARAVLPARLLGKKVP